MDKMVTLPAASMQRVVNYLVQRPWVEVDPLMSDLKASLRDVAAADGAAVTAAPMAPSAVPTAPAQN